MTVATAGASAATSSVASMPIAFETGPVRAKLIGVRPIETNQSKLCTRPRSSAGTRVDMSVPQTTMPAAMHAPSNSATTTNCQSAVPNAYTANGSVAALHVAYMNV